jgi:hypothetical protein
MAFAAPDERRRVPIPALDRVGKPLLEHLDVGGVLTRKRSPLENALQRLGHVEPGASGGRPEQEDVMFRTPLHETVALMPCEIVQEVAQRHDLSAEDALAFITLDSDHMCTISTTSALLLQSISLFLLICLQVFPTPEELQKLYKRHCSTYNKCRVSILVSIVVMYFKR